MCNPSVMQPERRLALWPVIVAVSYMPAGVSLRTRRDDINLTEICRQRGGGGHQKAAAFYLSGKTAEHAVEQILRQEV